MRFHGSLLYIFIGFICLPCAFAASDKFSQIDIKEEFGPHLLSDPMLMELGGAKIERLEDGRLLVLAVGRTPVRGTGPAEVLRCQTVCLAKAQKELTAKYYGVETDSGSSLEETTETNVGEDQFSIVKKKETYIRKSVKGIIQSPEQIGTWKSSQGDMFYLAIGEFVAPDAVNP